MKTKDIRESVLALLQGDSQLVTLVGGSGQIGHFQDISTADFTNNKVLVNLHSANEEPLKWQCSRFHLNIHLYALAPAYLEEARDRVKILLHGANLTVTGADVQSTNCEIGQEISYDSTLSLYQGSAAVKVVAA